MLGKVDTVLAQPTQRLPVTTNSATAEMLPLSPVITKVAAGLTAGHQSSLELPPARVSFVTTKVATSISYCQSPPKLPLA